MLPQPIQFIIQKIAFATLYVFSKSVRLYKNNKLYLKYYFFRNDRFLCDSRFSNFYDDDTVLVRPFEITHTIECFAANKNMVSISDESYDNLKHVCVPLDEKFLILSEVITFCGLPECIEKIEFHVFPWDSRNGEETLCLKLNTPFFVK